MIRTTTNAVVNALYLVKVTLSSYTSGLFQVVAGTNSPAYSEMTAAGTYSFYVFASGSGGVGVYANSTNTVGTITSLSCQQISGNHAYVSASANRPTITARYNLLLATAVLSTQSVTVGAGSYTLYFTGSGSVALSGAATGTKTAGSNVITCTAGTLTLTVTGSVLTADLRPSDQATGLIPTYQRVNTATDYDWSPAFPPMIKGNGSNQYLTGNLDLSSTNKVTVWAGVRKTSDAAAMALIELGDLTGTGQFALSAPNSVAAPVYRFASGGTATVSAVTPASYPAPITNVVTGIGDISAPIAKIRVNGVDKTSVVTTQGTGNYGSYPYYVLSRAGTSLFNAGGFNSLIVLGAAATAAQVSMTEAYCNQKLRAY